jgi:hypothetical protein
MLQPAESPFMVTEVLVGKGYDASQAVESVGFMTGEATTVPTALQAARGKVKRFGELL